jgi:hypothetical protein
VKTKHSSIRLDEATFAIIEKYQEQFSDSPSVSLTVERLIQAADGKKFITIIPSSLSHSEELSFFAGQLDKTRILWKDVRSRLAAPRPLDPNDLAGLKRWREDREKIERFHTECESLWGRAHSLSAVLTTTSPDEWLNMEDTAMLFSRWIQEHKKAADKATDPAVKKEQGQYKVLYENLVAFLHRIGVEPTPPDQDPTKKAAQPVSKPAA